MIRRPRARERRAAVPERLVPPAPKPRMRYYAPSVPEPVRAPPVYPPSTSYHAFWICKSAACRWHYARPSRSHDGASCDACGAVRPVAY